MPDDGAKFYVCNALLAVPIINKRTSIQSDILCSSVLLYSRNYIYE